VGSTYLHAHTKNAGCVGYRQHSAVCCNMLTEDYWYEVYEVYIGVPFIVVHYI
jgi:hypothetical protein